MPVSGSVLRPSCGNSNICVSLARTNCINDTTNTTATVLAAATTNAKHTTTAAATATTHVTGTDDAATTIVSTRTAFLRHKVNWLIAIQVKYIVTDALHNLYL